MPGPVLRQSGTTPAGSSPGGETAVRASRERANEAALAAVGTLRSWHSGSESAVKPAPETVEPGLEM